MLKIIFGGLIQGLFWLVLMPVFLLGALMGYLVVQIIYILCIFLNILIEVIFVVFEHLNDCSEAFTTFLKRDKK